MRTAWVRRRVQAGRYRLSRRLLSGPRSVRLGAGEAAVTCLVKNGDYYLPDFIEHYLGLGFRHIFLLDNGSTDETVGIASAYDQVSVYRCELPVGRYQAMLKRRLATTTVLEGWCLDVDIDEFFDYPYRTEIPLADFLGYLDGRGFSIVVTQMLDMFNDTRIGVLAHSPEREDFRHEYRNYDISGAERRSYRTSDAGRRFGAGNSLPAPDLDLLFRGIRGDLFGLDCLLTKHSLFRTDRGLDLFRNVHFVDGGTIADVSALLLHYKLVGNCYETSTANRDAFTATRKGYEDLVDLIEREPDRRIGGSSTRLYGGPEQLLADGFLFASPDYVRLAERGRVA